MLKKVYISSTFRDLKEYRLEIADTLRHVSKFFDIIGLMEFTMPDAAQQPPLQTCLGNVKNCDIYILIIGKLYGSIADTGGLSFTEREYRAALKYKKTIVPFIASTEAEGLKKTKTDNTVAFNRFRNEIKKNYNLFNEDFVNKYQLSKQLSLSLLGLSDVKWSPNENAALRCDREPQYLDMVNNKKNGTLNVFTIVCQEEDSPELFIERMATYEFGFTKEFIDQSLELSTFISIVGDYKEHQKRFIRLLLDNFIMASEETPEYIDEALNILAGKDIHKVFMYFNFSLGAAADRSTIDSLQKILTELNTACNKCAMTFFLIFVFPLPAVVNPDEPITNALTTGINFPIYSLERLPQIDRTDIRNWLKKYITQSNLSILKATNRLFSERDEYYMSEIFEQLINVNELLN
jgi:hypothetical protein